MGTDPGADRRDARPNQVRVSAAVTFTAPRESWKRTIARSAILRFRDRGGGCQVNLENGDMRGFAVADAGHLVEAASRHANHAGALRFGRHTCFSRR